jgi:hypothetical protein
MRHSSHRHALIQHGSAGSRQRHLRGCALTDEWSRHTEGRTGRVRYSAPLIYPRRTDVSKDTISVGRADLGPVMTPAPLGHDLQRLLSSLRVRCDVVAPSLVPKGSGDRVKTDSATPGA